MKKILVVLTALMMMAGLSSCETMVYAAEPVEDVVVTVSANTSWTFFWVFENGRYYRRACPVYYSHHPYYWGGPHRYHHPYWRPAPPPRHHGGFWHNRMSNRPTGGYSSHRFNHHSNHHSNNHRR